MEKLTGRLVLGILAHVDAGKTTLAESILYQCGSISKLGRVDHQDAFLDHAALERARGITIFAKQALLSLGERKVTLLDTPGHVDFSAEMERTLRVLDAAILVISASDGIQGHTLSLWQLLKRYELPVFLFINKMDRPDVDQAALLSELQRDLDEHCLDFVGGEAKLEENLAMCDEAALETYLAQNTLRKRDIRRLTSERKVFPCYFGSALRNEGVAELLSGIEQYAPTPAYPEAFGARVFKIARDAQNNRLTYMKITGGSLRVKSLLQLPSGGLGAEQSGAEAGPGGAAEKVDQIRLYSGSQYHTAEEAAAGEICAVTGLERTVPGMGLGYERREEGRGRYFFEPVLTYRLCLPGEVSPYVAYGKLRLLEEEDPQLHLAWEEAAGAIHVQVMGEVQIEILKSLILERFGIPVEFDTGSIVYKETITRPVIGVGHFEPLRHYAEVHLLLEPAERGSGLQWESDCSEDLLGRNWQRLIMTHLEERKHKGVLIGAELTDMKITLVAGRAHLKHTEGGDFRQATYRAVRQGVKSTAGILLEPVYQFRLEVPEEMVGRAMTDIRRMHGHCEIPRIEGSMAVLTGSVPVAAMGGYQSEVAAYTKGYGRLFCTLKGYEPCHNAEEIIAARGYDSEADPDHPTGSVFCAHGAGFIVPWDQVADYQHLDSGYLLRALRGEEGPVCRSEACPAKGDGAEPQPEEARAAGNSVDRRTYTRTAADDKELEEIFSRTYGAVKQTRGKWNRQEKQKKVFSAGESADSAGKIKSTAETAENAVSREEFLLVDGYNIIFAWPELKELAAVNLEAARGKLADILCNYQGYKNNTVILVFDAYRVEGNPGEHSCYLNIHIVYTKEAETADMYIEKTTHAMAGKYQVTVATSDALEQMIVWGQGAGRLSAAGLKQEIETVSNQFRNEYLQKKQRKNYLFDQMPDELTDFMEDIRLGQRKSSD